MQVLLYDFLSVFPTLHHFCRFRNFTIEGSPWPRVAGKTSRRRCECNGLVENLSHYCSFADVHYYYGPPSAIPPHHRFNKGSYVYLYEHAQQRRARLEIANNAGTPEQDAFDGCKSL